MQMLRAGRAWWMGERERELFVPLRTIAFVNISVFSPQIANT